MDFLAVFFVAIGFASVTKSDAVSEIGGSVRGFTAPAAKEVRQHRAALFAEDTFSDFGFVVERRMVHHGKHGAAGTGLGIAGGINESRDARMEDRAEALAAGYQDHLIKPLDPPTLLLRVATLPLCR